MSPSWTSNDQVKKKGWNAVFAKFNMVKKLDDRISELQNDFSRFSSNQGRMTPRTPKRTNSCSWKTSWHGQEEDWRTSCHGGE